MENIKKVLVTGTAGFIGFHLVDKLIEDGYDVFGLDIINDYYDVNLKYARLEHHGILARDMKEFEIVSSTKYANYRFLKADLAEHDFIVNFMVHEKFDYVVNLAAQAGVRYSIENPRIYLHSNVNGFLSILEGCKITNVKHLVYASTSSVYGLNTAMPLVESMPTEHPMALYAATKKANEMMAHSYSHLFRIPTTGLRFFTVFGPWGRPDMALFLFTEAILNATPIKVFNYGKMIRDFTYVGDIVESIARLIKKPAVEDPTWSGRKPQINTSSAPYRIFNIGNSNPIQLTEYINALEAALGKKAIPEYMEIQPGDVPETNADVTALENWVNYRPQTTVQQGINDFVSWYENVYMTKIKSN